MSSAPIRYMDALLINSNSDSHQMLRLYLQKYYFCLSLHPTWDSIVVEAKGSNPFACGLSLLYTLLPYPAWLVQATYISLRKFGSIDLPGYPRNYERKPIYRGEIILYFPNDIHPVYRISTSLCCTSVSQRGHFSPSNAAPTVLPH